MSVATIRACGAPTLNVNADVAAAALVGVGDGAAGDGDGDTDPEQAIPRIAPASMSPRVRIRITYT
jgi:hypothetical protein